jgi:hypothetical protein
MKEMIIEQLQARVGLSEEQATHAAKVVMELLEKHGGDVQKLATDKLGGMAGGLFGKK